MPVLIGMLFMLFVVVVVSMFVFVVILMPVLIMRVPLFAFKRSMCIC